MLFSWSVLLPDDCSLHETLSCNKGFELTHFMHGHDNICDKKQDKTV